MEAVFNWLAIALLGIVLAAMLWNDRLRLLRPSVRVQGEVIGHRTGMSDGDTDYAAIYRFTEGGVPHAGGQLGSRGPIPERSLSKLNITDVVHGSFGFMLEEASESEDMFATALKLAVDDMSKILESFSSPEDRKFEEAIEKIDSRTFVSIKSFFSLAHREGAEFRIVENDAEFIFDEAKVLRAFERVESVEFDEETSVLKGTLIGIIPIGRRFEFNLDGTSEVISGTIGKKLSADFIERIQKDEAFIGVRWSASFYIRTVRKPDGRVRTNYVLMDLGERLR